MYSGRNGSIALPYSGTSGYNRYQSSLSDRQLTMINKLKEVGEQFMAAAGTEWTPAPERSRWRPSRGGSNPELNIQLQQNRLRYNESRRCKEISGFRSTLPVSSYKEEILKHVANHQVFVLSGETGCGKTTQITQFILDHAIQSGRGSEVSLVCTQPRRVAAISVAERVAWERDEHLGASVGYQVKMDSKPPRTQGSILYCTAGILLQRLQSDRSLLQFSHILLDEVHERDVMTDIILVLLKEVLIARPDVKVILMSATLNGVQFSKFFQDCPVLHIPGFMHPVQSFYLKDVLEMIDYRAVPETGRDYDEESFLRFSEELQGAAGVGAGDVENSHDFQINIIAALIQKINSGEEEGAILVFLPGWEDICRLSRLLEDMSLQDVKILSLHGSMSHDDQRLIFQRTHRGVRKIVIGTNIAESSVTIDDIVFVIDSGRAKMKMFDPDKNVATLKPEWISKANSTQRKGRAGRLRPGKVYKIFSREREETFREYMLPEILRTRLENVLLKIKILDYVDLDGFLVQLLDSPRRTAVDLARESLLDIGAINKQGDLTPLGRILANLAADPQLGKLMVLGCVFSCLDPVLTVVAALEYKSPFYITKNRESVKAVDMLSADTLSDHLAVANAFAAWCSTRLNRRTAGLEDQTQEFCRDSCLSQGVLFNIEKLKAQYGVELHKFGLIQSRKIMDPASNANSGVEAVVRAVINIGLNPNIATIKEEGGVHVLVGCRQQKLEFHPKSVNREVVSHLGSGNRANFTPRWFVYFEKMETSGTFLNDTTSANPLTLILLASNLRMESLQHPEQDMELDQETRAMLGSGEKFTDLRIASGDQSLRLTVCKASDAEKIGFVRTVLDRIVQERIGGKERGSSNPNSPHGKVLSLLVRVLNADGAK